MMLMTRMKLQLVITVIIDNYDSGDKDDVDDDDDNDDNVETITADENEIREGKSLSASSNIEIIRMTLMTQTRLMMMLMTLDDHDIMSC